MKINISISEVSKPLAESLKPKELPKVVKPSTETKPDSKELPKVVKPSTETKPDSDKVKPKKIEIPLSEQRYQKNREDVPKMKKHIAEEPKFDYTKTPNLFTENEIKERFRQHYGDNDPRALMDKVIKEQEQLRLKFKKKHTVNDYVRNTGLRMILDTDYGAGELHSPETVYKDVYHKGGTTS